VLLLIWVSHQSSTRSFAGLNQPTLSAPYIDTDTTTSTPSAAAPIVRPAAQATDAPEAVVLWVAPLGNRGSNSNEFPARASDVPITTDAAGASKAP